MMNKDTDIQDEDNIAQQKAFLTNNILVPSNGYPPGCHKTSNKELDDGDDDFREESRFIIKTSMEGDINLVKKLLDEDMDIHLTDKEKGKSSESKGKRKKRRL